MWEIAHRLWYGTSERPPWLRRFVILLFAFLVPIPILLLLLFRFVPIPFTPAMAWDFVTLQPVHYSWRGADEMTQALGRAAIASEDENFCRHNGFDWRAIDKAIKTHERHPERTLHGASTISQQTARTLFLVSNRCWIRKGVEAYLTVLIEALWPKKRIMTVYLNLADLGHGNYGVGAASLAYFGKEASGLSAGQAARLIAVLPDPDAWSASRPGPYVRHRTAAILSRIGWVTRDRLDGCIRD